MGVFQILFKFKISPLEVILEVRVCPATIFVRVFFVTNGTVKCVGLGLILRVRAIRFLVCARGRQLRKVVLMN